MDYLDSLPNVFVLANEVSQVAERTIAKPDCISKVQLCQSRIVDKLHGTKLVAGPVVVGVIVRCNIIGKKVHIDEPMKVDLQVVTNVQRHIDQVPVCGSSCGDRERVDRGGNCRVYKWASRSSGEVLREGLGATKAAISIAEAPSEGPIRPSRK